MVSTRCGTSRATSPGSRGRTTSRRESSSNTRRGPQTAVPFNGTLSFNTDGSNPLNTNIGFANALLGAVTSYQEADAQPVGHGQFMNTEFYVQDNWRLKRAFTVDAGVRFYYITPTRSQGDEVAQFEQDAFSASAAPLLFQPITDHLRAAAR